MKLLFILAVLLLSACSQIESLHYAPATFMSYGSVDTVYVRYDLLKTMKIGDTIVLKWQYTNLTPQDSDRVGILVNK